MYSLYGARDDIEAVYTVYQLLVIKYYILIINLIIKVVFLPYDIK